jgi:hypothetical protein
LDLQVVPPGYMPNAAIPSNEKMKILSPEMTANLKDLVL